MILYPYLRLHFMHTFHSHLLSCMHLHHSCARHTTVQHPYALRVHHVSVRRVHAPVMRASLTHTYYLITFTYFRLLSVTRHHGTCHTPLTIYFYQSKFVLTHNSRTLHPPYDSNASLGILLVSFLCNHHHLMSRLRRATEITYNIMPIGNDKS